MTRFLAFFLFLFWVLSAEAAEIGHAFASATSAWTHTGDTSFTDITGASIGSGSFTTGKKYLLLFAAQMVYSNAASGEMSIQSLHGTTAFGDSEQRYNPGSTTIYYNYTFFTVWTAVASEGVKLQGKTSASGNTITVDQVTMTAINLSDDILENTDWFFNERTTDDSLTSTSFTDGGSVTFTPAGSSDWLVISESVLVVGTANGSRFSSQINRSGEASSSAPNNQQQPVTTTEFYGSVNLAAFSLTNASNTFKEQSNRASGTATFTRNYSAIFAVNLNKFKDHVFAYTTAELDTSGTDFATQTQTASLAPSVTGDVWSLSAAISALGASTNSTKFRHQIDNSDDPASQTSDAYSQGEVNNANVTKPLFIQTVSNLDTSSHTFDQDASSSTTGTGKGLKERVIIAMTMNLAGSVPIQFYRRLLSE